MLFSGAAISSSSRRYFEKLLTRGPIASSRLYPATTGRQELGELTLIKRCQRQSAPPEPAAEIVQQVTLCTNRVLPVPLA